MRVASRTWLTVLLATSAVVLSAGPAEAMDCPCTWEWVICEADAVAEVEITLATKTTPDRMKVRRMIWNRTKHRLQPGSDWPILRYGTKTRQEMLNNLAEMRRRNFPPDERSTRYRRALKRGSYRLIVIAKYLNDRYWFSGGVAFISQVHWLDHPRHAEWWAKVQPFLKEKIEADKRHEKPASCANVVDVLHGPTQFNM